MCFMGGISVHPEALRHRRILSVGWDQAAPAGGIVANAMERALDTAIQHNACAQGRPAMGAEVAQTGHTSLRVSPEHEFLTHAHHAQGLARPDLTRFEHHIPLVGNHGY